MAYPFEIYSPQSLEPGRRHAPPIEEIHIGDGRVHVNHQSPLTHVETRALVSSALGYSVEESSIVLGCAVETLRRYRRDTLAKLQAPDSESAISDAFKDEIFLLEHPIEGVSLSWYHSALLHRIARGDSIPMVGRAWDINSRMLKGDVADLKLALGVSSTNSAVFLGHITRIIPTSIWTRPLFNDHRTDPSIVYENNKKVVSAEEVFIPHYPQVSVDSLEWHEGSFIMPRDSPLSSMERFLLALTATGHEVPDIAALQSEAPSKVRSHLDSIFRKFGTTDRNLALDSAFNNGIIITDGCFDPLNLDPLERAILRAYGRGQKGLQVVASLSREFGITSRGYVRNVASGIISKLGVRNMTAAVTMTRMSGDAGL